MMNQKHYYDPMFYYVNEEHPNLMALMVILKDAVDAEMLRSAAEKLRERYSYFMFLSPLKMMTMY